MWFTWKYFGYVGKIFNSVEVCYSEKEINVRLGSNKSSWIFFILCVLLSSACNDTESKGCIVIAIS